MTQRPPPPPPLPTESSGAPWLKLAGFLLVVMMLAGIVNVLLDPGFGTPNESRRARHPEGFSIAYPEGWGASVYTAAIRGADQIQLLPERSTGRQSQVEATLLRKTPKPPAEAQDGTFQGQPAKIRIGRAGRDSVWEAYFQRAGNWYRVSIQSPLELDWPNDPLMKFAESFRIDAPASLAPASAPAAETGAPASPAEGPLLPVPNTTPSTTPAGASQS